jgi:hypothetical protein
MLFVPSAAWLLQPLFQKGQCAERQMVFGTRGLSLVACTTWIAAILSAAAEECCSAEPEPVPYTMFDTIN